jgi:hypothetical protein
MMFLGSAHLYHELLFLLMSLLLGTLPISAELHKRQLCLLHQIAMSENVSIREIAWRQYNVDGSWRGLPYPSFLDLVFQGHIVISGSRRLGRVCMMFLGSAHLYHELLFLLMSKAFS